MLRTRRMRVENLENRELLTADAIPECGPAVVGDSDLNGHFDSTDIINAFKTGKFETGRAAGWADGDWNCDNVFDATDLVFAMQSGNYRRSASEKAVKVNRAEVGPFQPAGSTGGGVLTPGDWFAPGNGAHAIFRSGADWVGYNIHTSGLPAGAYTNWLVVFGNPDGCVDGCGEDDVVAAVNAALAGSNTPADVSVLWSDGGIVGEDGIGSFRTQINVGEAPGQVILPGSWLDGTIDLDTAEFHAVIKYHGPASDDPDVLAEQTHTLLGSCDSNANANTVDALPEPLQTQCFDPQAAVLRSPG